MRDQTPFIFYLNSLLNIQLLSIGGGNPSFWASFPTYHFSKLKEKIVLNFQMEM